jgi:hypothetical protein
MPEDSSWQTTTGLLDDFEYSITDAWFARSAEIKNGEQLVLFLKGDTDNDAEPEFEAHITCGPGWDTHDGGKSASHESRKERGFNKQTNYGQFIDRIVELGLADVLQARGKATEAKVWVGLKFHMKQKEFKTQIKGEDITYYRLLPEAFLGEVAEGAKSGEVAAPVATGAATNGAASNGAGAKVLLAKLKAEAKKHDTHEAFVDAAMEIPGVTDDDDLLNQVIDEAAIYAMARA